MQPESVRIKLGNLFDSNADTFVIPVSAGGSMTRSFENELERLGIYKLKLPISAVGSLQSLQDNPNKRPLILFATSVDGNNSNYNAIEQIAYKLGEETHANSQIQEIACPLLGTGAGGLNPAECLSILSETFSRTARQGSILNIYIFNSNIYNDLKESIDLLTRDPEEEEAHHLTYYAVESLWQHKDQYLRFIEEDIWENFHEIQFTNIVSSVLPNDILILKDNGNGNGDWMHIKAIGEVLANPQNGHILKVNWSTRDLALDMYDITSYRNTISKIDDEDVQEILERLSKSKVENTSPAINPAGREITAPSKIANLISDAASGVDQLDIDKDVMAFAKVMAYQNFKPPLAVALFGKWGSGKSFFMQQLRTDIKKLTEAEGQVDYCQGIAQIHFNAWSYLDANLWASLVSRIFEGLQEYITGDDLANGFKNEILAELTSKLVITYEEVSDFEVKKKETEDKIKSLEKAQRNVRKELGEKISAIEKNTLSQALKAVSDEFKVKKKLELAVKENHSNDENLVLLKKIIPGNYWENPEEFYQQIRSTSTFFQAFFEKKNILINVTIVLLLLACIFILPHFVTDLAIFLETYKFSIPHLQIITSAIVLFTPILLRTWNLIQQYRPLIASVWSIKEKHQQLMIKVTDEFHQKEKSIQLEIHDREQQLLSISQRLQQAQSELHRIDYKIKNALATEALYSFIEKRCKSEDYQKMLGIVSVIRKDFETLSNLFVGHQGEAQIPEDKRFSRPLSRIILYIDDLDRCPEERVVEVLEAVNLLMAFRLFIVVVGVDPRWVTNALVKRYQLQFSGNVNPTLKSLYNKLDAADYLEKIFQVPFHLKPASPSDVKKMIRNITTTEPVTEVLPDPAVPKTRQTETARKSTNVKGRRTETASQEVNKEKISVTVALSEVEIKLLEDMSVIVGSNPRAIKRFVNTYQIIRGHQGFTYLENESEREFLVCLFLLALPTGQFRELNSYFVTYFENTNNATKAFRTFFELNNNIEDKAIQELKTQLDVLLIDGKTYQNLQNQLLSVFKHHYQFIRRFTFEDVDGSELPR